MTRIALCFLLTLLPIAASDVLWTGSGTVTSSTGPFGVTQGDRVDLTLRYAPEGASTVTQNSTYIRRKAYHGGIKLRIEVRVGTKQWISYTSQADYPAPQGQTPFEVVTVDPSGPQPPSGGGDFVFLRAYSFNGAQFEQFHYPSQTPLKGINLIFGDATYTHNFLDLGQFPGTTANATAINSFSGTVLAGTTDTYFQFAIDPATLKLGEYLLPLSMTIHPRMGGGFLLKFATQAGKFYDLEGSQDLKSWFFIGKHVGVTDGNQTISAPTGVRYFRLRRSNVSF